MRDAMPEYPTGLWPHGQGAAWPVVETVQRQGICVTVLAPAPGLAPCVAAEAEQLGLRIAEELAGSFADRPRESR